MSTEKKRSVWKRRGAAVAALAFIAIATLAAFALSDFHADFGFFSGHGEATAVQLDALAGATFEPLDRPTARQLGVAEQEKGLVVTSLAESGPAARAGIRTGDVIVRVGDVPIRSTQEAVAAMTNGGTPITITLNRHGRYAMIRLPIRTDPETRGQAMQGERR